MINNKKVNVTRLYIFKMVINNRNRQILILLQAKLIWKYNTTIE
jgi:hypothetical protein